MPPTITLIQERQFYTVEELAGMFPLIPRTSCVIACDFTIEGIEQASEIPGGYRKGQVINIDHHAPSRRMQQPITSTALACEYVRALGVVPDYWPIVLNHTDADSVLATLILTGMIKADGCYCDAALAADHTGEPSPIADLLNSMARHRDFGLSERNFFALTTGRALDQLAESELRHRHGERQRVQELVEEGIFQTQDGLAYTLKEEVIDTALLLPVLPEAKLIVTFNHLHHDSHEVKIRLGLAAPKGMTLFNLGISTIDPNFGGRWNAGGNRRGGGTRLQPQDYLNRLEQLLANYN